MRPTSSHHPKSPKISVTIPAYNDERFIGEAITSVLNQTFENFEIVVWDDASTDRTGEVVHGFHDSRIDYRLNDRNLGVTANFDRCISSAHGEYVYLLNADDKMLPRNLEKKAAILDQNSHLGLVHSSGVLLGKADDLDLPCLNHLEDRVEPRPELFEKQIRGRNQVCSPSVMVRRECYDTLGGFDSRLQHTADTEMWSRVALFYDTACLSEPLIQYRWHDNNDSHNFNQTLRGVTEAYIWKTNLLREYGDRIPNQSKLLATVAEYFLEIAVRERNRHLAAGRVEEAQEFLRFAHAIDEAATVERIESCSGTIEGVSLHANAPCW